MAGRRTVGDIDQDGDAVAAVSVTTVLGMSNEVIRQRLHDALHRGHRKATEEEVSEVAAFVLAIVTELTAEMALVIAELEARVATLEARS